MQRRKESKKKKKRRKKKERRRRRRIEDARNERKIVAVCVTRRIERVPLLLAPIVECAHSSGCAHSSIASSLAANAFGALRSSHSLHVEELVNTPCLDGPGLQRTQMNTLHSRHKLQPMPCFHGEQQAAQTAQNTHSAAFALDDFLATAAAGTNAFSAHVVHAQNRHSSVVKRGRVCAR